MSFGIRLLILLFPLLALGQQAPANFSASIAPQNTLLVGCHQSTGTERVSSPVWLSEDRKWHSYVEVSVQGDGCLHTTRLWVGRTGAPYRVVYLIPPKRTAAGNGMEVLGWARNSAMLLVMAEEWQIGSDAPATERVLAVDARTGMVYEPNLQAMVKRLKDKQCSFRVMGAGFGAGKNVDILVRARFSAIIEQGETEAIAPAVKVCGSPEQTWSFDFATGEIKQVPNSEPLQLFKMSVRNGEHSR